MTGDPTDAWIVQSYHALIDHVANTLDLTSGLQAVGPDHDAEIVQLAETGPAAQRQQLSQLAENVRGVLDLDAGLAAITARSNIVETAPASAPILIIDDHELVGVSLASSLRAEGETARFELVRSAAGVLEAAGQTEEGLVVLDLDLGRDSDGSRIDGVSLVEPLCRAGWRVVVLSGSSDAGRIGASLAAGGFVWVPKNAPFPTLLAAIREARQGRSVMPPGRREQLIEMHRNRERERRELATKLNGLTQREREVLALLAAGKRAQAVADHFAVSLAAVRTNVREVLVKLDVESQLEAVTIYRRTHR